MSTPINQSRRFLCLAGVVLALSRSFKSLAAEKPSLKLAKNYAQGLNIEEFFVSEKYDGVRVLWTGTLMLTRGGNAIKPPAWWLQGLPAIALDGELWIERGAFSKLNGLLKQSTISDDHWRRIQFLVFDLPNSANTFEDRYVELASLLQHQQSANSVLVKQYAVSGDEQLMNKLSDVIARGGEGLMLQRRSSIYHSGRSSGLYKLKRWQDAEATVIGMTEGRGKYLGVMGALIVETPAGVRFRVGSGFSDLERAKPPRPGTVITYRYAGKSKKGVPRFASFVRARFIE